MDYLDSIDCSLEDFQAMLYEKQFGVGVDFDTLEVKSLQRNNKILRLIYPGQLYFLFISLTEQSKRSKEGQSHAK